MASLHCTGEQEGRRDVLGKRRGGRGGEGCTGEEEEEGEGCAGEEERREGTR